MAEGAPSARRCWGPDWGRRGTPLPGQRCGHGGKLPTHWRLQQPISMQASNIMKGGDPEPHHRPSASLSLATPRPPPGLSVPAWNP